jgi:hypothetical protein
MFIAPPAGFPQLEAYVRQSDGSIPAPPDLSSIGEKVYRLCVGISPTELNGLRSSTRRRIPYAMWLDSQRDINSREDVVSWYYSRAQELELDGTTRTRRFLTPLLHTYVSKFARGSAQFDRLANNLNVIARRCAMRSVQTLKLAQLDQRFDFFNPQRVGQNVAAAILDASSVNSVERWFESVGLWPGTKTSPLGLHVYRSALLLPPHTYKRAQCIDVLMQWTRGMVKGLSAELKGMLAEALLKPWLDADPAADTKIKIADFCVEILGDPRFDAFSWSRVGAAEKSVLLRWLTGRTLDAFFDVLRNTADSIWQHRQVFWIRYYREGHITEAWAILGPDAHRYVNRNHRGADLAYGRLVGKSDEAQSVLLMRMGDLVFCEWSHNGKLRVTSAEGPLAPKLYKKSYDASDLKFTSLSFLSNTGHVHEDGLPHLHSENRWWQTTAAAFIAKRLGIRR